MARSKTDFEELAPARLEQMLRERGIDMSVEGLMKLVIETISSIPEVEEPADSDEVSTQTQDALDEVGLTLEPYEGRRDPVVATAARFSELVAQSLSTAQAADLLGVQTSRVRQRLNAEAPTLYGFKHGREWRLPRFQFRNDGLVHNFDKLAGDIPRDWTPLEVKTWCTTPNPDLAIGEETTTRLTPLQWLESGGEPDVLSRILSRA